MTTPATPKKKIGCLKIAGFVLVGLLLIIVITTIAGGGSGTTSTAPAPSSQTQGETTDAAETVPVEHRNALKQAKTYSSVMHMSKQGVYDQLVSDHGGKFDPDAAQYAVDNVEADWNKNALEKAKTYQNQMSMSRDQIREQLVSPYGEKFTEAEADYAMANLK